MLAPIGVDEVALAAVASLGESARQVVVDVPESLPDVAADPALLERALANLIGNAARVLAARRAPVRVTAGAVARARRCCGSSTAGRASRPPSGSGCPSRSNGSATSGGQGVGLGLAIAKGFVEAMRGELTIDDTPGGGTTMVIGLPRWAP